MLLLVSTFGSYTLEKRFPNLLEQMTLFLSWVPFVSVLASPIYSVASCAVWFSSFSLSVLILDFIYKELNLIPLFWVVSAAFGSCLHPYCDTSFIDFPCSPHVFLDVTLVLLSGFLSLSKMWTLKKRHTAKCVYIYFLVNICLD